MIQLEKQIIEGFESLLVLIELEIIDNGRN